ncbi:preprotein translocase subunit SecE [Phenylobacterium sp.]|jgi:preprotein translocase subunit SecE|uniref:preprotein translocase subunit SecE n=1 Tax=Phenylobacterium sp. TaxID=1871053 RepID=UPI002E35637E|nr:preprotein translocase subunit SecE [Phenylobacterium sp.]HEX2562089.1 preprotein translocase subunit SecE [Phenylobacterium sp.]
MARKPSAPGIRERAAKTAAAMAAGSSSVQAQPKKKTPPAQFFREVRAEARKITWTSRKETWITSVMVGIMVALAAVFFLVVDFGIGRAMQFILSLTNAG